MWTVGDVCYLHLVTMLRDYLCFLPCTFSCTSSFSFLIGSLRKAKGSLLDFNGLDYFPLWQTTAFHTTVRPPQSGLRESDALMLCYESGRLPRTCTYSHIITTEFWSRTSQPGQFHIITENADEKSFNVFKALSRVKEKRVSRTF